MNRILCCIFLLALVAAETFVGDDKAGTRTSSTRKCQILHGFEKISGAIKLGVTVTPVEAREMIVYVISGNLCVFGEEESSDGYIVHYDFTGNERPVGFFKNYAESYTEVLTAIDQTFEYTAKYNNLCVAACQVTDTVDTTTFDYTYDVKVLEYTPMNLTTTIHMVSGQNCYNVGNTFSETGIRADVFINANSLMHTVMGVGNDCGPIYSTPMFVAPKTGPSRNRVTTPFSFMKNNSVNATITTPQISASFYCYYLCAETFGKSSRIEYSIVIQPLDISQSVSFKNIEGVATAVSERNAEKLKNDTVGIINDIVDSLKNDTADIVNGIVDSFINDTADIVEGQVTVATASFSKRLQAVESKQGGGGGNNILSIEWIALIIAIIALCSALIALGLVIYLIQTNKQKSKSAVQLV